VTQGTWCLQEGSGRGRGRGRGCHMFLWPVQGMKEIQVSELNTDSLFDYRILPKNRV
jgi:hypothetical protein